MKLARNARYRAQLEAALKHVETQLKECGSTLRKS
jgi:enamine deaminase RidA (YjgF/YER057c/UK114 family)